MNAYITALRRALHRFARSFRSVVLVLLTALGTWGIAQAAASGPANLPMLSSAKGAAPNVMLTLDNSGSMDWKVLDTYPNIDAGRKSSNGSSFPSVSWVVSWPLPHRRTVSPLRARDRARKMASRRSGTT